MTTNKVPRKELKHGAAVAREAVNTTEDALADYERVIGAREDRRQIAAAEARDRLGRSR